MSTETWISDLTAESKSLKQVFDRSASMLTMFTKTSSISTTRNAITKNSSSGSTVASDPERILVTFNTLNGYSTVANLEIESDGDVLPDIRVQYYSGGLQWVVTGLASFSGSSWRSTKYSFTVHSMLDGNISVAEISS